MGYSIYIGPATIEGESAPLARKEFDAIVRLGGHEHLIVPKIELPSAPVFEGDEATGRSNQRSPSYTAWFSWTSAVGLTDLFSDLLNDHPGIALLTTEHASQIALALKDWRRIHGADRPGFGGALDGCLARLIWLDFWVRWAIGNSSVPAIYNH
jgi:hypothetical protein